MLAASRCVDLSTGEFDVAEYAGGRRLQALRDEIAVLRPREIVVATGHDVATAIPEIAQIGVPVTEIDGWHFELETARQTLLDQLRVQQPRRLRPRAPAGGGLRRRRAGRYLRDTQKAELAHVRTIRVKPARRRPADRSDHAQAPRDRRGRRGRPRGSLLDEIDRTVTPMGGRLLRTWLLRPLTRSSASAIGSTRSRSWRSGPPIAARCARRSRPIQDLERLIARIALATAGPRDLVALRDRWPRCRACALLLSECQAPLVRSLAGELDDLADVRDWIEQAIVDEPPALARDGGFVRDGVDARSTSLRHISRSGKQVIAEMEERERARTGIASLKVRFNRVFGYYIEISKSNLHAVPPDYIRKQTIAGGERFITPALKEYEEKVLGADERIVERELELFEALRARVAAEAPRVLDTARALAALDVLAALAETATPATTPSRTSTTATRSRPPTCAIRSSSGWPAARSCRTTSR